MSTEDKTCQSCGRRIEWRKKWERDWANVRYCSSSCRSRGTTERDLRAEEVVRGLLASHPHGVTDADATTVFTGGSGPERPGPGLSDRETVRRAARRLVAAGELELLQRGRVVDPSTASGPVLIRRRRPSR